MTTGNKLWAIGRAVERALAENDTFYVYQYGLLNSDDWAVRISSAAPPRGFHRRFTVQNVSGVIRVYQS